MASTFPFGSFLPDTVNQRSRSSRFVSWEMGSISRTGSFRSCTVCRMRRLAPLDRWLAPAVELKRSQTAEPPGRSQQAHAWPRIDFANGSEARVYPYLEALPELSCCVSQSTSKPSANEMAAATCVIRANGNREMRAPICIFGTVCMLSKLAQQVFGRPSSFVNSTSVGMLRIVDMIGATVSEFSTPIAESRVSISTGRRLSGILNVYQQTSPRFPKRPSLVH